MPIDRDYDLDVAVRCSATETSCDPVDMRNFAGAVLVVPVGSSITSIAVEVGKTETDTFLPLYDADNNECKITPVAAGRAYELNAAAFGAHWLKFLTDADGTIDVHKKG